ncbi:ParB/RepB/Spo0J family partition protein [Kiritimatiella glycovorans]|uniref:Putative chromosome-partitioning protein ParB n=1 Tax=Kiritimatiella glycovorans TaxID=1307763 RepID=A0A0G3EIV5_9BACT|nr:ParB/RepB/Spo0J family partition protein [Kiritimatiella glycovorans]AKJ64765.1 putative chromosome-partitioning protein ParB [Kiritimatiella glycovorans]
MAKQPRGLGRGLSSLMQDEPEASGGGAVTARGAEAVAVAAIRANPSQPRSVFGEEAMQDLVRSVHEHGVLQPLIVRPLDDGYELVAGERRLRAARMCGLEEVPCLVRASTSAQDSLEIALIENLQREDLNPVEEAEGYRRLIDAFELTQEEAARRVGRSRAAVTNALRLLDLPDGVKRMLAEGRISEGHAKLLLGLEADQEREHMAARVVREGLSVRALEKILRRGRAAPRRRKPPAGETDLPEEHARDLSDRLHRHFGTRVRLTPSRTLPGGRKQSGRIEIEFYGNDDLHRLLQTFGMAEDV